MSELSELVLDLIAQIPRGQVSTYGTISNAARSLCGSGSARTVGRILAEFGARVPWWRVVNSKGELATHLQERQYELLSSEGTKFTGASPPRIDLSAGLWVPELQFAQTDNI